MDTNKHELVQFNSDFEMFSSFVLIIIISGLKIMFVVFHFNLLGIQSGEQSFELILQSLKSFLLIEVAIIRN